MIAYIHIGTEKTGTTAVQEFLYLNREKLRDDGVYFDDEFGGKNSVDLAVYSRKDSKIEYLIRRNKHTTIEIEENWRTRYRLRFRERIEELSADFQTFIFSSEHLSSCLLSDEEVEKLRDLLDGLFDEIKIIVYIRRQDLLAVSRFNEILKAGNCSKSVLSQLSKTNHHIYDYNNLVNMWANVYGEKNIIVRVFDIEKLVNKDIVDDFMSLTDIPYRSSKYERFYSKANKSLTGDSQRVLIGFNCLSNYLGINRKSRLLIYARKALIFIFNKFSFTSRKTLSREEAMHFYHSFSDSNEKLFARESAPIEMFSTSFEMYCNKK